MKVLIIGRTATGKDTLRELLMQKYGWTFVKSMATRPQRTPDENTHIFISQEESNNIPMSEKAAWTKIGDYEYFATRQQIHEADAYIIDPLGARMLLKNMPEEWFRIIYLQPADNDMQMEMAIKRTDTPEKEINIFKKRASDENQQFTDFETEMQNHSFNYPNCSTIIAFTNTYQKEDMEQFADELNKSKRFAENLEPIINMMMHNNIMNHTPDGEPILTSASSDTQVPVRIGELIDYMEQDKEMLGELMFRWLPIVDMDVKNNPITVLYKP